MGISLPSVIVVHCDNNCVQIVPNDGFHEQAKHMRLTIISSSTTSFWAYAATLFHHAPLITLYPNSSWLLITHLEFDGGYQSYIGIPRCVLRATPAVLSILSLYVYYSVTLYLFFQTNSLAVLSIHSLFYLNIVFYSFISFKYYIFYSFFIIISRQ